jgi:hypothetical protein
LIFTHVKLLKKFVNYFNTKLRVIIYIFNSESKAGGSND